MVEKSQLPELAQILQSARLKAQPVKQLSQQGFALTREQAYEVQEIGMALRAQSGENLIGLKMGLTSEGKRKQMNLDSPLYGELSDKMQIEAGAEFSMSQQIHPKIEPEVAFLFDRPLKGEVTREEVLAACSGVCACLEILDSRYDQFKYFSMEEVIADNSSSSHFVLGPWVKDFNNLDLVHLNMTMKINGETAQQGVSSAISGDPVISVIELCRLLEKRNRELPAGQFVLAGAATAAVALEPGMKVELDVDGLPSVNVFIKES